VCSSDLIAHRTAQGWALAENTPEPLTAISGNAPDDIWAVGDHGVAWHFDGQRWTRDHSGAAKPLRAVFAIPHGDVIAVGTDGNILRRVRTKP